MKAIVVLCLIASATFAQPTPPQPGLTRVSHGQDMSGNGTTPVPLTIRVASGGGLTTNGATTGIGIIPCATGQTLVWNGTAYACADLSTVVAGTLNNVACFTPDGSHVGNCAATDDGNTFAIAERASITPPSGGTVGSLLIAGTPSYQFQTTGDTSPTFDFRTTSGLTTLQLTNDAAGGTFAVNINGNAFISGAAETGSINGTVIATALTDVGIQAAINAAPPGGQVNLLSGSTYILNAALPITIAKPITIDCQGWGSPMQVAAGVGGSTPVFLLKPSSSAAVTGITFRNCAITTASGTPASNGFAIDGTNGPIGYLVLDHVYVAQLGSFAVAVQNAGSLVTGTPYNTQITNASLLYGGANFTNAGDTIGINGSTTLAGVGSLIIDAAANSGTAGLFTMDHATSVLSGGIVVKTVIEGSIRNSNLEQTVTSTEANNCMIDVQGNTGVGLKNFVIEGNYIGADASFVGCAVRVDHATNTQIVRNYVSQGASNAYTITANANRTRFISNRQAPDNVIGTFLSDAGTFTTGEFLNQATGAITYYGLSAWSNASSVTGVAISSTQIKVNPTNGIFGVSTGDPSATGNQVTLWSSGSNAWRMGTAYGDASANLALGTLDVAGAATADGVKRLFDVAGTGLSSSANTVSLAINSGTTQTCASDKAVSALTGAGITTCSFFYDSPGTGLATGATANVVKLADTAVSPGSYTYGSFTVDQQGRLTAASSGTAPVTGTGTANTTTKWTGTGTGTIGNAWALDDATSWGVSGKFLITEASGAFTGSSTAHIVGAATLDSTLTTTQISVGTTSLAGGTVDVVLVNNTAGTEPSAWDTKWATFGAAAGASGGALALGYSTTTGASILAWAPGSAYKALTFNALSYTWQVSHVAAMNLDSSSVLHVGAGADASTAGSAPLIVSNAGNTGLTVRDSTNDVEWSVLTNSLGNVKEGTFTNHVLNLVTNNVTAISIGTNQDSTFSGHIKTGGTAAGTPTGCGTSPTITGDDNVFTVVPGATATSCTIPFSRALNRGVCTVTSDDSTIGTTYFSAISTTSVTVAHSGTGFAGDHLYFICF